MPGESKPQRTTRPASSAELVESARNLYERLSAAVAEFDRNEKSPLGVPNMAVPIRALACEGQGNRLITRVCAALNVAMPKIQITSFGEPHYCDTVWMGNIPFPSSADSPSRDVALEDWIHRQCLVIDHEHERIALTWSAFLRGIAEKRGYIHSDNAVPAYFAAVDSVMLSDLKLSDWMFRKAAGAILQAARELLVAAGVSDIAPAPGYDSPNRIVSAGMMLRGIFAPTPIQKDYEKRFNDCIALARREKPEAGFIALMLLAEEIRTFETLFYRRLRAAIAFELGNLEALQNRPSAAMLHWGKLVTEYAASPDTYLQRVVANSRASLASGWR